VQLRLDVHDIANNPAPLGTLSEAFGRSLIVDIRNRGTLTFAIDEASTADIALLAHRRIIRAHANYGSGWVPIGAFIIDDMPKVVADDVPSRVVRCQGLLGWLGFDRGGAVLYPRNGVGGRNPRLFGWQALDYFQGPEWGTPVSYGTQASPVAPFKLGRPVGWPDPDAHRLYGIGTVEVNGTLNHPSGGTTLFRQPITIPPGGGRYMLEVNGENYSMWFDGAEGVSLSMIGAGATTTKRVVELPAGPMMLAGQCSNWGRMDGPANNVSWLMWTLAEIVVHPERGDELGPVLARSEPGSVSAVYSPNPWPGVTAGYVMDVALTEDAARYSRPWTWDFGRVSDSYGQPWAKLISHEFRIETLGRLSQDLGGLLPFEMWAEADSTLRAAPRRGQWRGVTVARPFGLDLSGEGPRITRALYETQSGFGRSTPLREGALGVMEDVLTLGTGLDRHSTRDSVDRFVAERSREYNEIDVELPDDVRPFVDVFPGDTVVVDGVGPYRLMTLELTDGPSQPEWAAFAMPEQAPQLSATVAGQTITVSWATVDGAVAYEIEKTP
jgi:hypothetical protein